jgi:hypothetical protein
MFEQVIASGANTFIIIVALVIGFVAALSFLDNRKTTKENEHNEPFGHK